MIDWNDTICAIATPEGVGAIGVVRLSGSKTFEILEKIFSKKNLFEQRTHSLHYGLIKDVEGHEIDEVLVGVFKGPNSFTGEDVAEISGHGSPYVLSKILEACQKAGARLAQPGEFTRRAFLKGKYDLAQAEAIADLIAAESKAAHEVALNQLRGGISNELALLREKLVNFTALIELELDFSDEDVAFADRAELKKLVVNLKTKIQELIKSFGYGNAIKNGVPVAIIGKPNAGKSTLLNALLKEERAIVSDIAGTTRDVIEETITLAGITFRFIDTAGIRHTVDTIEAIGVERAHAKVRQAKIVIHLYEDSCVDLLEDLAEDLKEKTVFNLLSKSDKTNYSEKENLAWLQKRYSNYIHFDLSVKNNRHLDLLEQKLVQSIEAEKTSLSVVITNLRHKEALEKALKALEEVERGMNTNLTGDLLSIFLKDALSSLGSITGEIDVDKDILGAIFGRFCIGK